MIIINGAIELEQCKWPGNIGDSMADTSRLHRQLTRILTDPKNARTYTWHDILISLDLTQFRTPEGYLRSLKAPCKGDLDLAGLPIKESWREDDTSGDQYMAWYLEAPDDLKKEMRNRVVKNFLRYGNNQLIHPGFGAQLANWQWLITRTSEAQRGLFEFTWRWDDEHNQFREMETSSADYLNYSMIASDAPEWLRKLTPAKLLKEKYANYWKNEPNVDWYLEIAFAYCDRYF